MKGKLNPRINSPILAIFSTGIKFFLYFYTKIVLFTIFGRYFIIFIKRYFYCKNSKIYMNQ